MQVLPVSLGSSCIPVRSHHTDMFPVNQTHSNSSNGIALPRRRREGPLSRDQRCKCGVGSRCLSRSQGLLEEQKFKTLF
ncbi:hypothetical protein VZT92_018678 [Zoarces viviparus]|uniref:Uncharacterized protein n=1 Tax=Zoarces viviparus TaxID=48416 RepID=A0AAW1EI18_ZOAVI